MYLCRSPPPVSVLEVIVLVMCQCGPLLSNAAGESGLFPLLRAATSLLPAGCTQPGPTGIPAPWTHCLQVKGPCPGSSIKPGLLHMLNMYASCSAHAHHCVCDFHESIASQVFK